ncbi:YhjD/YihY/BrkB family envelope integrity protein [Streptomyces sp. NPDC056730]|uniref:YhjD/YihY/BrkB family envelope integrity protein n=1 Tax=unclassified Streptomyces TaxID=2593676 RepID=UPI00369A933A
MDWLKKLPLVGPFVARLTLTHAWRSYETLDRVHWTRLAAAITFISFIALFPLITVGAAIGAALLSQSRLDQVQDTIAKQVPGISQQLDINGLVANAGTVGVVAGALLLLTGIGWVGSMRECLRAVWELDDAEEGNPFLLKGKDAVALLGLGAVGLASLGASGFGSTAVGWSAERLGIPENGAGGVLLQTAALVVAVLADFLLLLYVLTLLPRVHPPRRRLVVAALIGAIGFELLKLLLGGYVKGVAAKSMYGAFGVPVALLLWINFTAKLLLFCAAWTATPSKSDLADEGDTGQDAGPDAGPRTGQETEQDTGPETEQDTGPETERRRGDGNRAGGATRADGGGPGRAAASAG